MLFHIIILAIFYLVLYFARWKKYKGTELVSRNLMYIYMCLVLFLTILPIDWTFDPKWKYHSSIKYSYGNIKPFNDLLLHRSGAVKEVVLNVMMTIPFGFLYSFLRRGINLVKIVTSTFIFSLSIELTQLIMTIFLLNHRSFDITDLITNTIGGCIGYLIFKMVKHKHNDI